MQSVLKGKGAMPPRGGNPSLSDALFQPLPDSMPASAGFGVRWQAAALQSGKPPHSKA